MFAIKGELHFDLIADSAELRKYLFFCPSGMSRVIEWPVIASALAWIRGTYLVGVTADRDDNINSACEEVIH